MTKQVQFGMCGVDNAQRLGGAPVSTVLIVEDAQGWLVGEEDIDRSFVFYIGICECDAVEKHIVDYYAAIVEEMKIVWQAFDVFGIV